MQFSVCLIRHLDSYLNIEEEELDSVQLHSRTKENRLWFVPASLFSLNFPNLLFSAAKTIPILLQMLVSCLKKIFSKMNSVGSAIDT